MPSTLSWLDHDSAARERSQRLLALFRETDTRDELGIGAVRDSIAGQLFPGTSVIQTRLRYMLLIPWLFTQLEKRHESAAKFPARAREAELRLRHVLTEGNEDGVFGRRAGDQLKRMASSVYWAGMGSWGLRVHRGTQQEYFRQIESIYAARARRQQQDDGEWLEPHRGTTWHPALVELMPEDFPDVADLTLTRDEALFIREQWRKTHPDSLLAWLSFDAATMRENMDAATPWLHPRKAAFLPPMRALVEHGRCFSELMTGATLLYNLRLCQLDQRETRVDKYRADLALWGQKFSSSGLGNWDLDAFWVAVMDQGHVITAMTRGFVNEWLRLVRLSGGSVVGSLAAATLIEGRERDMKGERSRFKNPSALKQWGGASGLEPLTYRWSITRTFLADLKAGLDGE